MMVNPHRPLERKVNTTPQAFTEDRGRENLRHQFFRLDAFLAKINIPFNLSSIESLLGWTIERFVDTLTGSYDSSLNNADDYVPICKQMGQNFSTISQHFLYYRVHDLVSDIWKQDFKLKMCAMGLTKKRFLNDVFGILCDIASFIKLAGSFSPLAREKTFSFTVGSPRRLQVRRRSVSFSDQVQISV